MAFVDLLSYIERKVVHNVNVEKRFKRQSIKERRKSEENDGRYIYQYTDSTGKRRVVYSNDLLELREKEKELVRNQLDGL